MLVKIMFTSHDHESSCVILTLLGILYHLLHKSEFRLINDMYVILNFDTRDKKVILYVSSCVFLQQKHKQYTHDSNLKKKITINNFS